MRRMPLMVLFFVLVLVCVGSLALAGWASFVREVPLTPKQSEQCVGLVMAAVFAGLGAVFIACHIE